MIIKDNIEYVDNFQNLIAKSRAIIADGHFVDISDLQQHVDCLFGEIKKQHGNLLNADTDKLKAAVESTLNELDHLKKEMERQHNNLFIESKVLPRTATAAYKS